MLRSILILVRFSAAVYRDLLIFNLCYLNLFDLQLQLQLISLSPQIKSNKQISFARNPNLLTKEYGEQAREEIRGQSSSRDSINSGHRLRHSFAAWIGGRLRRHLLTPPGTFNFHFKLQ